MIYHITLYNDFAKYIDEDYYEAESLKTESFIHCSTKSQVAATIKRYYSNQVAVLLLHIDEAKLTSPLKYELATSVNENFPHIYGQINKDAIVKMQKILVAESELDITKKIK